MYSEILADIRSIKKPLVIVLAVLIASFILGIAQPSLLLEWQQSIIDSLQVAAGNTALQATTAILLTNLLAAALGIFLGIVPGLPIALAAINGYIFGAVTARAVSSFGLAGVVARVLPHGIIELPMIVLSFGFGLAISFTLIKNVKNVPAIYKRAARAFIALIVPLLLVAALIEGFLFANIAQISALQLDRVFFSIGLLYLFYCVFKLLQLYKAERDMKYLVILLFLFIIATDLWSRAYGFRVKELFETYGFLFLLIPLGVFLLYTYMEHQKYKEERAKARIKGAFQQYVAPEIIEELLKHPEKLKLGGEKKRLTIFFSDIRGFTGIAEQLSPEQLVHLLNEYLSAMTDIILKHKGVVDKYMGDAIMAFWGAPIEQPNHAELACASALEMSVRLAELQQNWRKRGIPELRMGIGLNSGDVVVGNMGSNQRFDYTVMGDAVNVASRLEGLNKIYGTTIIIGEEVWDAVKGRFAARELDLVQVKGREQPMRIYELLCTRENMDAKTSALIQHFEKGLAAYRAKRWADAIKEFKSVLAIQPEDGPAKLFIARCTELQRRCPPDWRGVYVAESK